MTWNQYKTWVSELVQGKISFYYRGQANETWKLQTSFHREANNQKITLPQYIDTIIPEVIYHISAIHNEFIDLRNEHEFGTLLALVQHHGFPTPLLDWTLSPYMAAYFAFREVHDNNPISDNIKIYIFNYEEWAKSFHQLIDLRDTMNLFVSIIRPYAKFNPRLIAQQGVFTITNVDDMEEHIILNSTENNKFLHSFSISVKEKPNVMRELNLMGINDMTMFPGIEGICRALKSKFFSPDTVGITPQEWHALIKGPDPQLGLNDYCLCSD